MADKEFGFVVPVSLSTAKKAAKAAGLTTKSSDLSKALIKNSKALKDNINTFIQEEIVKILAPNKSAIAPKGGVFLSGVGKVSAKDVPPLHTIIDGLSSKNSYVVIARRQSQKNPSFIAVKDIGGGSINVKFYPNFTDAGYSKDKLISLVGGSSYACIATRPDYQRIYLNKSKLDKVLTDLLPDGYEASTSDNAFLVLAGKQPNKMPRKPSKKAIAPVGKVKSGIKGAAVANA